MKQSPTKNEAPKKRAKHRISKKPALVCACTAAAIFAVWKLPSALADKQLKNIL